MIIGKHRNTQAIIDLDAIKVNIQNEIKQLKQAQSLFAVVKADAYGHGLLPVAEAAKKAGAKGFCVAVIDEALALRQAGFDDEILVLGVNPASTAVLMAQNKITCTVGDYDFLIKAQLLLKEAKQKLLVHIALDTGMGRIGFKTKAELKQVLMFMQNYPQQFEFDGIFTHFASADSEDETYYLQQLTKFNELLSVITKKPRYIHVANSAASLWHRKCGGNMIRFGIAMYGLNPNSKINTPFELKPALSLVSELAAVKKVTKGEAMGYGSTYRAKEDEWIGTVPIGYADGWLRRMQGFKVLVDGHYCEIVGRVCMDQMMIRLPKRYDLETRVTLIGEDHGNEVTAQDVADYAQTIHYEITCGLAPRVTRLYKSK